MGQWVFGCDICQEVCPYNAKAKPSAEEAFLPRAGLYVPQLTPLLSLDEETFRRRFRGSPVLRAKRRGFLRNVAVALGNIKSREAVPMLIHALDDAEALVRGHAAWALGQIGSREVSEALQRRLAIEPDREVYDEMEDALRVLTNEAHAPAAG
jgi:epoxyqueuosine reductase